MRRRIVTMVVAVLVTGPVASSAPRLHGQARDQRPPAATPAAWGTPVEGVQLRLSVASNAPPYLPGQIPSLEVQLRNQGPGSASYVGEALVFADLEVDGIWHAEVHAGSCCSARQEILAGAVSVVLPRRVIQTQVFELDAQPAKPLVLAPGRHTVRVRSRETGSYDVRDAMNRPLALTSNAVTFDIPTLSPDAERQALVTQTSAGDGRGLRVRDPVAGTISLHLARGGCVPGRGDRTHSHCTPAMREHIWN